MQTGHAIATALNVVQTSHSYGDLMLLTRASQSKQVHILSYIVLYLYNILQIGFPWVQDLPDGKQLKFHLITKPMLIHMFKEYIKNLKLHMAHALSSLAGFIRL